MKAPRVDAVRASPNHQARPAGHDRIVCVVLHATADAGNEEGAEHWMRTAGARVSAHLHIRRDGRIVRLVPDERMAWHAGVSEWNGTPHVNDYSLGWELANRNDGREPYTESQYAALADLGAHYARQGLPIDAFVSHAEVARPRGRKNDPRGFDWPRFRAAVKAMLTECPRPM